MLNRVLKWEEITVLMSRKCCIYPNQNFPSPVGPRVCEEKVMTLTCCGAGAGVCGRRRPPGGPARASGCAGGAWPPGPCSLPCHWSCSASAGACGVTGCAGAKATASARVKASASVAPRAC